MFWKRVPNLASAADKIEERIRISPLMGGGGESVGGRGVVLLGARLSKKTPAREHAWEHDRYEMSLWVCSIMFLVLYLTVVFRCDVT